MNVQDFIDLRDISLQLNYNQVRRAISHTLLQSPNIKPVEQLGKKSN